MVTYQQDRIMAVGDWFVRSAPPASKINPFSNDLIKYSGLPPEGAPVTVETGL